MIATRIVWKIPKNEKSDKSHFKSGSETSNESKKKRKTGLYLFQVNTFKNCTQTPSCPAKYKNRFSRKMLIKIKLRQSTERYTHEYKKQESKIVNQYKLEMKRRTSVSPK